MTKFQRKLAVIGGAVAVWVLLWGTLGYFVGLRGVGFGWPSFWAVAAISLFPMAVLAVTTGVIWVYARFVAPWIERGRDV